MARPSKYKPAYCDLVIEHMTEGASITSFAAEIGVARSSINEWMEHHEEFSEAVKIAKAKCAAWWEKKGRTLAVDGGGNATLVIFGLKNMAGEDWRDKHEIDHSGKIETNELDTRQLSRAILAVLGEAALEDSPEE
jgi:hypothetical protein